MVKFADFRGFSSETEHHLQVATPRPFGESALRGNLLVQSDIRKNVEFLQDSRWQAYLRSGGSYQQLLGGDSAFSILPTNAHSIPSRRVLRDKGLLYKNNMVAPMHDVVDSADYPTLIKDMPLERYKFYSSFDLTTKHGVHLATEWFGEVVEQAAAHDLSLTAKSFDHTYDSLNLYTWHPEEISDILANLYSKYHSQGLYSDTPHFFQGKINGINPDHIGYAQEPHVSQGINSHSVRMGILGHAIDESLQNGYDLSPQTFILAAQQAGVKADRPYLLDLSK